MPRRNRTPKERERFLIREFISCLDYRILSMRSWERPDAVLKVTDGVNTLRIGVEHTDYYVDAPPGSPSPGAAICDFWELVQMSLVRRISHRPGLQTTRVHVSFRRGRVPALPRKLAGKQQLARSIASELVGLALAYPLESGAHCTYWPRELRGRYPLLASWLNNVMLWRPEPEIRVNPYFDWRCVEATASAIGPVAQHLVGIMRSKVQKAQSYNWHKADERWLLVTASASSPQSAIGRWTTDVERALAAASEACRGGAFDRVFVWERIRSWCKQVLPNAPVVHFHGR